MPTPTIGKFLAAGRTADIYEWEPGFILKLFNTWRVTNPPYKHLCKRSSRETISSWLFWLVIFPKAKVT